MANRPRNIALPVILAIGIAVATVSLLTFRDGDGTAEPAPAESTGAASANEDPETAAQTAQTMNRGAETADPGDEVEVFAGEAPMPGERAPADSDTLSQRSPAAAGTAEEADTGSPSSSRRNVMAGGSSGGSGRRVSSGSAGSAGSAGSTRGSTAAAETTNSDAPPLTVFAEQPQGVGSGRELSVAESDRSSDTDSIRTDASVEDVTPEVPPKGQKKREDPGPTSTPHVVMATPASEFLVGESIPVVVRITEGTDVGHVPFHVTFDPAVVRFEYGEEGFYLGSDGNQTAFFAAPTSDGRAVVVGLSRLGRVAGVGGGGDLCVLHFTATGPGNAALSFVRAKVRDSANRIVPSVFVPASVTVR